MIDEYMYVHKYKKCQISIQVGKRAGTDCAVGKGRMIKSTYSLKKAVDTQNTDATLIQLMLAHRKSACMELVCAACVAECSLIESNHFFEGKFLAS